MIQIDLVEFDMFKFQDVDDYIGLQALKSIELVQPTTIIGVNVAITNLVANVLPNGRER
jgi:hypothetical protein